MHALLVGLGARAASWIEVCRRNADVSLAGYVEPVPQQRDKMAERFSLPGDQLFSSLQDACAVVAADFIVDVTPPAAHEGVALEAFELGLHVIGEKPMSDTFAAAKRMVDAARQSGRTHMITQNYRVGRLPRTTHRVLKSGIIGDPGVVSVGFYRAWASRQGTHYTTMPYPLLTDMGIHHFDLLRYVLDREPVQVRAQTWNPPWKWHAGDAGHAAVFEFEGGMMVTHHSLGCSTGKQSPWNGDWRIEGPEGSLTWEDDHLFHTCAHPSERARREEIPLDELPHTGQDALLTEFVSAIGEQREPECSSRDNLKSLAMVFAAIRSAEEGRVVEMGELLC